MPKKASTSTEELDKAKEDIIKEGIANTERTKVLRNVRKEKRDQRKECVEESKDEGANSSDDKKDEGENSLGDETTPPTGRANSKTPTDLLTNTRSQIIATNTNVMMDYDLNYSIGVSKKHTIKFYEIFSLGEVTVDAAANTAKLKDTILIILNGNGLTHLDLFFKTSLDDIKALTHTANNGDIIAL